VLRAKPILDGSQKHHGILYSEVRLGLCDNHNRTASNRIFLLLSQ